MRTLCTGMLPDRQVRTLARKAKAWVLGVLSITALATGSPSHAAMRVTVGDLEADFSPDRCWTLLDLHRNGQWICQGVGSGQGTVISVDGLGWAGSVHGNETLLETSLLVDGQQMAVVDSASYSGACAVLTRKTDLDGAYRLTSVMTITQTAMRELVVLEGLDASKNVTICYGLLGSRANRLVECAGFDSDGALLGTATAGGDDYSVLSLTPATAVAQYDPVAGEGVCSAITAGCGLDLVHFIHDRPTDNKLYCRFGAAEGPADPTNRFILKQYVLFFDSGPEDWIATAGGLVPRCVCPGDANGDACVDGSDYTAWADHYKSFGDWEEGDFTGDGVVDGADYTVWADNYGYGTGGGSSVPEPAALALLALGALVLPCRWNKVKKSACRRLRSASARP